MRVNEKLFLFCYNFHCGKVAHEPSCFVPLLGLTELCVVSELLR